MTFLHSIFINRNFAPLYWVQFLGALNDNIIKNILVIVVRYKHVEIFGLPPNQLTALAGGLFILPYVLFSPYAGLLADSICKVKVMRLTKIWELLISAIALIGFYTESYLTLLIYLSDVEEGGETCFEDSYSEESFDDLSVTPAKGKAIFFEHSIHHKGEPVRRGRKYVLRSDVMYAADDSEHDISDFDDPADVQDDW